MYNLIILRHPLLLAVMKLIACRANVGSDTSNTSNALLAKRFSIENMGTVQFVEHSIRRTRITLASNI